MNTLEATLTPPTLKDAKRTLEKALNAIQTACLTNRCEVPMTEADRQDAVKQFGPGILTSLNSTKSHPGWQKIYYLEQPKKLLSHLEALAKDFPDQAAIIGPLIPPALSQMRVVEEARVTEKNRLNDKRSARAERAAKVEELGVDLAAKGGTQATEATFKLLRNALAAVQEKIAEYWAGEFRSDYESMQAQLIKSNSELATAFPCPPSRFTSPRSERFRLPQDFRFYFDIDDRTRAKSKPAEEIEATIQRRAKALAEDTIVGYSAKLAGKIDTESNGAKVAAIAVTTGRDVWHNSAIRVALDSGESQCWNTHIILNRSCLGKIFNQWPTRLSEKNTPKDQPLTRGIHR